LAITHAYLAIEAGLKTAPIVISAVDEMNTRKRQVKKAQVRIKWIFFV